jgi:site-specific DNA recombinase
MNTKTAVRAGIYNRISKDKNGERAGVDRQLAENQALADRLGWPVTRIYTDNDVSASKFAKKKRPGYQQLRDDIANGVVNAVISWAPDRLHRRAAELETWLDLVGDNVAHATCTAGLWDLSTPAGRMTARILGNVGQYESEHRSDRVKAALKEGARNGAWHGGIRCFGYDADGLTVRESEAVLVREIAENICKGVSLRSMARDLNGRGVATVSGKRAWTQAALRGVMTSPRLAGLRRSREVDDTGRPIDYPGQWPAILDATRYQSMMAVLSDPARFTGGTRRGRTPTALGTGVYRCGNCDQPSMRKAKTTAGAPIYRCGNIECSSHLSRRADTLDAYVTDAVIARLSQPGFVQQFADLASTHGNIDQTALVAERNEIGVALNELAQAADSGAVTTALALTLARQTRELTARAEEIGHLLAQGVTRSPVADLIGVDDIETAWHGLTLPVQRAILAAVVTVTVRPGKRGPGFDAESIGLVFAG